MQCPPLELSRGFCFLKVREQTGQFFAYVLTSKYQQEGGISHLPLIFVNTQASVTLLIAILIDR